MKTFYGNGSGYYDEYDTLKGKIPTKLVEAVKINSALCICEGGHERGMPDWFLAEKGTLPGLPGITVKNIYSSFWGGILLIVQLNTRFKRA